MDGRIKSINFVTLIALGILCLGPTETLSGQFLPRVHVVDGREIKIGMSSAATGRLGFLGGAARLGCQASLLKVNEAGGVSGRKVVLIEYDDKGEPIEAVSNTERLIEHDNVFAFLNYLGTETSRAILPMLSESNIVLVGPISGSDVFRQPVQPLVFNTRASYSEETESLVSHLVSDLGVKRIALFREDDSYGDAGRAATIEALGRRGLELAAEGSYVRNSVRAQDALYHIARAKPDAVLLFGTYKPCADFIRGAKQLGLKETVFCCVSSVGTEPLANYLGAAGDGVIVSQVVPSPYDGSVSLVRDYQRDMQALGSSDFSYMGLEGYLNGIVLVTALQGAVPGLTEEKLIQSLENLDLDFKGFRIRFGPNIRQGSDQVFLTRIRKGRAMPIEKLDPADYKSR